MKGRPVRYRLDTGERFAIVGTARVAVALERPALPLPPVEVDTRYTIDCRVVRAHDDETVTIACALREVETAVRSPVGGLRARDGDWRAAPWLRRWARALAACPGQPLDVRKSLYGDIVWVAAADPIRRAMVGIEPTSILQWYGGLFPRDGRPSEQIAHLDFTPAWAGLPVPGRVPVEVRFRYRRRRRRERFEGRALPTFDVDITLDAPPRRYGPLVLEGHGTGGGSYLADTERGKIARSLRAAAMRFELRTRRRTVARFAVTITSDAWHEDHPPRP